MAEELKPEVRACLDGLDKEKDPWRIAEVLKGIIPPARLEEGIRDFDSKYSLRGGNVYKGKGPAITSLEQHTGTPESMLRQYIGMVGWRHGSLAEAWQKGSFTLLRIAVIAEWAKRKGYTPPES